MALSKSYIRKISLDWPEKSFSRLVFYIIFYYKTLIADRNTVIWSFKFKKIVDNK